MNKEDQNEVQCKFCLKFFPDNSEHYCAGIDGEVELPMKGDYSKAAHRYRAAVEQERKEREL